MVHTFVDDWSNGVPLRSNINERQHSLIERSTSHSCRTCSSLSLKHQQSTCTDERNFVIHEHERGVSLPMTMKIDYDNIGLRLSTSMPAEIFMYSNRCTDVSSSTYRQTHRGKEIRSHDVEQRSNLRARLNTINTITTTDCMFSIIEYSSLLFVYLCVQRSFS
jgi:hypothetical protein